MRTGAINASVTSWIPVIAFRRYDLATFSLPAIVRVLRIIFLVCQPGLLLDLQAKLAVQPPLERRANGYEVKCGELTPRQGVPRKISSGKGPCLFQAGSQMPPCSPSRRLAARQLPFQEHGHVVRINCWHCETNFRKCLGELAYVVDAGIGQIRFH